MSRPLGKLVAVHAISSAHVQRAAFIGVLSFLFFLGMMVLFYIRESLLYFLLASAFLVVYVITMLSWVIQRKNVVQIFEGGFSYKSKRASWDDISDVGSDGVVSLNNATKIVISPAISNFGAVLDVIRRHSAR